MPDAMEPAPARPLAEFSDVSTAQAESEFDYVVIGSGAGGGPAAANLAEAGHRVLLKAGLDPRLIRADLFFLQGPELDRALRSAVVIHASDTATVLSLRQRWQLAPAVAQPFALISGLNPVLASTASRRGRP